MNFDSLVHTIHSVQDALQEQAAHAVNIALTTRNWLIGYNIVEFEQHGEDRAAYGEQLLKTLETKLNRKGLTERRFREFRRLYLTYPQLAAPVLAFVASDTEIRRSLTAESNDSIRRLPTAEFVEDSLSIRKQEAVKLTPVDILHEPVTLEFLGFKSKETWTESDLEEAIIDHMQEFLLEMGNGFCFEARQKRILIDSDYFKADLIFYHRILKCHIIVDIKIDRFRHEYASQMNTYLNYYRYEVMQPDDNPPVGLLLCTGKGDTLVKYATAGLDQNIFVQKYMINLPSVEDLTSYIEKETEKEIGRLSSAK